MLINIDIKFCVVPLFFFPLTAIMQVFRFSQQTFVSALQSNKETENTDLPVVPPQEKKRIKQDMKGKQQKLC